MTLQEWAEEDLKLAQQGPELNDRQINKICDLVTNALHGEFIKALIPNDVGAVFYDGTCMRPMSRDLLLDALLTTVLNQVKDTLPFTKDVYNRAVMAKVHKALFYQYKMQCNTTTHNTGVKAFDQYISGSKGEPINLDAFILGVSTFLFNNL